MNILKRFLSLEVVLALLIIVAYFLPWIDFGLVKQIGWEIPKLQRKMTIVSNVFSREKAFLYTSYAILLLPILSIIVIALWGLMKRKTARIILFVSGILGAILCVYLYFNLPKHSSSGVYLMGGVSSLSVIYCILLRKYKTKSDSKIKSAD